MQSGFQGTLLNSKYDLIVLYRVPNCTDHLILRLEYPKNGYLMQNDTVSHHSKEFFLKSLFSQRIGFILKVEGPLFLQV